MAPTQHLGVYALWRQDTRLVLVRKPRGPYDGLLDLPGGSPDPVLAAGARGSPAPLPRAT